MKKIFNKFYLSSLLLIPLVYSCTSTKPYINKEVKSQVKTVQVDQNEIKHKIFLIGDAGEPDGYDKSPNLQLLRSKILAAGENSTVVFLGDNIYPVGLPEKENEEREESEKRINAQLSILKGYKGRVVFIPGNHDWKQGAKGGSEQNKRAEQYINSYLGKKVYYPSNSCAGPEVLKIADDMILVAFDSQWWLHRNSKSRGDRDDCSVSTRSELIDELRTIVMNNLDKKIVVAAHHPLFSNGNHGGYFSTKEHIFPLTSFSKLYLPLPVLGSIYPWYRKFSGNIQDIPHPEYQLMKDSLMNVFSYHPNIIYAAGHEHNLQFQEQEDHHFIVSGSGSKTRYLKKNKNLIFGQQALGFSELELGNDGRVILNFWNPNESQEGSLVFSKEIIGKTEHDPGQMLNVPVSQFRDYTDSLLVFEGYSNYGGSKFKRLMIGNHYRGAWMTSVKNVPVVDIKRMNGGMKIVKIGGNHQTTSVRLETEDGKHYVLRSVDKDPSLALPLEIRKTFAKDLAQDQMTAAHPYGALAVIKMADAAGIYHTNPKLMYVPNELYLGKAKGKIGNSLVLYEERPHGNWSNQASFGNSKKIIGTPKLILKMAKSHDHYVDQRFVVKNRIFDTFLNDWDRHDDQWRWASFETEEGTMYRPIPRDRDQVFYKFDGVINFLASRKWGIRMFQHFDDDVRDIPGLIQSARWFDRTYTTEVPLEDWIRLAKELQTELTDEVIEASIKELPKEAFDLDGEEIIRILKARRDNLVGMAERQYKFINKEVEVVGSDQREFFYVRRLNNDSTLVQVYAMSKKGKQGRKMYERIFIKGQTREVRLFGYGGKDRFIISGNVDKGIIVKVIGGKGNDEIIDESNVKGWNKKTHVYDLMTEQNQLELGKESKDFTDYDIRVNEHNRKAFKYNKGLPLISLGYNKDDNLFVGAGYLRLMNGFRKDPYKQRHKLTGNWSSTTNAYNVKYKAEFIEVLKRWDITGDVFLLMPDFNFNFYGYGNETEINEDAPDDYYAVKFENITIKPGIRRKLGEKQYIQISPFFQSFKIQESDDNILADMFPSSEVSDELFESTTYTGIEFKVYVPNFTEKYFPQKGSYFNISGSWNLELSPGVNSFNTVRGELGGYYTLDLPLRTTLASRGGFGHIFGDHEFYQSMFLSGDNRLAGYGNMRGLNRNRYAGETVFYHNNEVRTKLFSFSNSIMAADFGVNLFFDHGRVWENRRDNSNQWHYSYGGGIWLYPFQMILANVSYGIAENDEDAVYFGLGFFF